MAEKQKKPKVTDPSRRLPGFTTSYANHISIEFTKLDLTLVFGNITKTETESEIHVSAEEHSSVKMTLAEAKILAVLLAVNVADLEKDEVGTIKIPIGILPKHVPDDMVGEPVMDVLEHVAQARKSKESSESEAILNAPELSNAKPS